MNGMASSIASKILLVTALLLSSCATKFDSNEQKVLTDLRLLVDNPSVCSNISLIKGYTAVMKNTADWLVIYHSSFANSQMTSIYANIRSSVSEIYERYQKENTPSVAYCENKLENIKIMTERAAKAAAGRQ